MTGGGDDGGPPQRAGALSPERRSRKLAIEVEVTSADGPVTPSGAWKAPPGREPALVVIYGQDLGKAYPIDGASLTIGRSSKCDIQIDQESISRQHTKVTRDGDAVVMRDLSSTNGTYVNDEAIEEHVLEDGDLIKIGRTIFKFLSASNIERSFHEEMRRRVGGDPVARMVSRRYFIEELEREIVRSVRQSADLSLVLLRVESFEGLDKSDGQPLSDLVLNYIASVARSTIKTQYMFARWGTHRLLLMLPGQSRDHASKIAGDLKRAVEQHTLTTNGESVKMALSFGVAEVDAGTEDSRALILRAAAELAEQSGL